MSKAKTKADFVLRRLSTELVRMQPSTSTPSHIWGQWPNPVVVLGLEMS